MVVRVVAFPLKGYKNPPNQKKYIPLRKLKLAILNSLIPLADSFFRFLLELWPIPLIFDIDNVST